MTRKKLGKVLLVWLCIITLLMPFASEVLAATLNSDSVTAVLESIPFREGGKESTGVDSNNYDTNSYKYSISGVNVLKVVQHDNGYNDTFYCLDAKRSLSITKNHNYKRAAKDLTQSSDSEVEKWKKSVGISEENYKALIYLLNNIYAKKLDPSYKNNFIQKAFAERIESDKKDSVTPPTTVDMVKEYLTDDDIEVIQQWAIWYFTNGSNKDNSQFEEKYSSLGNIEVGMMASDEKQDLEGTRKEFAKILYDYLIKSAKDTAGKDVHAAVMPSYPTIDRTNEVKMDIDGDYYKVGPFKINGGSVIPNDFTITISTEGGDITKVDYKVYEGNTDVTDTKKNFNFDFDKDYYIYLPVENNTISKVSLKISYTEQSKRNLSLWTGENDSENLQPLVLILQDPGTPVEEEIGSGEPKPVEYFDLSLQKFISDVNGTNQNREPEVDVSPLKKGEDDAKYTASKNPVGVETGDIVTFTLRVYNEGDIDGYAEEITDYIPEGLGFIQNYNVNEKNQWKILDYLNSKKLSDIKNGTKNVKLDDFKDVEDLNDVDVILGKEKIISTVLSSSENNKDNLIKAFDGNKLSYKDVQVSFIVVAEDEVTLKNIAAITKEADKNGDPVDTDRVPGKDSTPKDDIDPDKYTTGNEDDDDYDVVKTNKKDYDLALRKFIVSVNGVATSGRTPNPTQESLEKLANGNADTAEYNHAKSPISVKVGDRIVYEFRIYNEGDFDAKVQEIVDYLPEGLKIVDKSESTINSKFNWTVNEDILRNKYLENTTIKAFDKTNKKISYGIIQLECEIVGDFSQGTTLTNVAEIVMDDGDDRDSKENSIDQDTINDKYSGNTSNKDDLTDSNYYYKGLEDDDDFEKVIIAGKQFDLSLQKFISTVNGEKQNREPKVDVSPLKNGKDDATYTTSKNAVGVETGDIVTFTLRVYNEGEVDGYAEEITDYIPEGLGFLVNYDINYDNRWKISDDSKSKKLSEIKNGTKNVTLDDFMDVENLNDVEVVLGKSKITSTALVSSETSTDNLIKAFDGNTLSYKDVQVSFIVVTEDEITLKNIAAITKEVDKDRNPVDTDRGPGRDSTPKDDIDPDKYTTGNEDDDDYDVVKTGKKDFDLALQKFITRLNETDVKGREPIPSISNGKISYNSQATDPLYVGNGDLVEYTIRVFNEGQVDGYAAEIKDDIPNGLVFVPDNETNKEYEWKMYDKSGNETTDPSQAVSVKTTYLSKDKSEENIIRKFDGSTLLYKDVKLVFKVVETAIDKTVTSETRTLTNTAEITKATDEDGNDIPDIDSTPNNNKIGEDDIDQEKVYVKYFDLALEKNLNKAIVTTNGTSKEVVGDQLKIEIHKKNINSTSIQFVYTVKVTNQGEIEGYATEITDYIPDGLSFNPASNPDWTQVSDRIIKSESLAKTLLKPGESAEVQVVLDWVRNSDNIGRFINIAEISEDWNPYNSDDVDSTPNNQVATEDDQDDAPVWVGIVTGLGDRPYIILTSAVLIIFATGIVLIKKYVL